MAITSGGNIGTAASGTSGTTLVLTPTNTLTVGRVGVLAISSDNIGATDGDNGDVSTVVDSVGNTWFKMHEHTNSNGAAAAGVTMSIWKCKPTTQITSGNTITITFRSAITDKCASCWSFNVVTNLEAVALAKNDTDASNGFGSSTVPSNGTLPSREYLYFRGLAKEANTTTDITVTTNYNAITLTRSRNNSAAVIVRGEYRIVTATSETSNPTLAVSGDTAA